MSHFTVAIITKGKPTEKKIEEILAPYQENNMGDCPEEYLAFNSVTAEQRKTYEEGSTDRIKMPDGSILQTWDEIFKRNCSKEEKENWKGRSGSDGWGENAKYYVYDYQSGKEIQVPYTQIYSTFEEFMKDTGEHWDEKAQDWGYWENPNRKWDWWVIGGRWRGLIEVPSNSQSAKEKVRGAFKLTDLINHKSDPYKDTAEIIKVDMARVKDILQADPQKKEKLMREWELLVEGAEPQTEGEKETKKWNFYKPEYYLKKYGTKERYADLESRFTTFAVITKDGKWHESGKMGWFACVDATLEEEGAFKEAYKEFVFDKAEEDDWLTVIDCHI